MHAVGRNFLFFKPDLAGFGPSESKFLGPRCKVGEPDLIASFQFFIFPFCPPFSALSYITRVNPGVVIE